MISIKNPLINIDILVEKEYKYRINNINVNYTYFNILL